jgi:hypothetical protein
VCVFLIWRVRGDTPAARATASHLVNNSFEGLRDLIPGMKYIEVDSSEDDYAGDAVRVSEFESVEGLEAYASQPGHLQAHKQFDDLRTARFQVDYAIGAQSGA